MIKGGGRGADAGEIRAKLTLETDQFKRNMEKSRESMRGMKKDTESLDNTMKTLNRVFLSVGATLAAAVGSSVRVAADFEQSMARVKAVSGATEEEFKLLKETARELGAATQFSASEAADGMNYLAMAGFKVNEIVSAMPSVLNLAAAAQLDLARSSDIVSNIMTGFGLTAEETERAVDVLVQTMTSANTDLNMLGDAMKYVAPFAASLGFSIEETAAAVGKLSDAGIQGSQAGTVLRAALVSLVNPTGQTAKAMETLNIELKNVDGTMKDLPSIIGEIARATEHMEESTRAQTIAQLVGREAASGFLALLEVGEERLRAYTRELENSAGAAERIAEIQQETLYGAVKRFQSALEELKIALGEEFLPVLTNLVESGTQFVRVLGNLNPEVVAAGMTAAGAAVGVGVLAGAIQKLWKLLGTVGRSHPVGRLIMLLSLLTGAFTSVTGKTEENIEITTQHVEELSKQANQIEQNRKRFEELMEANGLTNEEMLKLLDIQKRMERETNPETIQKLAEEYDKLQEKSGLSKEELDELVRLNNELIQVVPDANVLISEQGSTFLKSTDAAKAYTEELREQVRIELERQRLQASDEAERIQRERKEALEELNRLAEKHLEIEIELFNLNLKLQTEQERLNLIKQKGNEDEIRHQEMIIDEIEKTINGLQQKKRQQEELILDQQELLNNLDIEIKKHNQAYDKLVEFYLKQLDLNAAQGEELNVLDEQLQKLREQRDELQKKKREKGSLNDEEQELLNKLNEEIKLHENAKVKIKDLQDEQRRFNERVSEGVGEAIELNRTLEEDITKWLYQEGFSIEDARSLNQELDKNHTKTVTVNAKEGSGWSRLRNWFFTLTSLPLRHNGGTVHELPTKYHTGGIVRQEPTTVRTPPLSPVRPRFDEVDVRLLRDEMVLTRAQQANLFRMIETFNEATRKRLLSEAGQQKSGGITNIYLQATVREEADIRKIAEEMEKLSRTKRRSAGNRSRGGA